MNSASTTQQQGFPVNREIVRLSLPAIVSNITVPLLGLCDTAVSGHLGSASYLGAIAVGSMMLNVIFWIFGFLRMGTTGMTALAFGASDIRKQGEVFSRALALALSIGTLLIVFRHPLMELMLGIIAPDGEVAALARGYFLLCIWEAPALLATMVISGWFIGTQSTFWPMVIAISVNIVNILLSVSLVFGFEVGFNGIAAGTLSANWIGLAIAFWALHHRTGGLGKLWCGWRALFDFGGMGRFFKVNSDLFIRSACITAVSLGVTALGARQGALILAANAVMMQFFHFFSFFMDGFAFTGEALTGRFAGARDQFLFRRSVNYLYFWTLGITLFFVLLYWTCSGVIASLLTDDAGVLQEFSRYSIWIVAIPLVSAAAFIYDGFYIGIASTGNMLLSTLLAATAFAAVCFLHGGAVDFSVAPDNNRLWCAFSLYLLTRGVTLASLWPRVSRKLFKL